MYLKLLKHPCCCRPPIKVLVGQGNVAQSLKPRFESKGDVTDSTLEGFEMYGRGVARLLNVGQRSNFIVVRGDAVDGDVVNVGGHGREEFARH